ncbi:MAG: nuclear transport factor 2 family protein [Chitinophagia bacterium]|jgi:ketosteroid isomerase-like protein|nr:nuclear transport factor 2 family protein [Chitinophagia bacterium]
MKNFLLAGCLFLFFPAILQAQDAETQIKQVINSLFDGMRNADAAAVAEVFSSASIMQTIATDKSGKTIVRSEAVNEFSSFVGKQAKGAADEQIVFETIKVDGPLAVVWTPYRFIYNGKYSHSGVNVFCLVKLGEQWKIQYLIDTRRK